jgi:hypothetical protein
MMNLVKSWMLVAVVLVSAGCATMGQGGTDTPASDTPVGTAGQSGPAQVEGSERNVIPVGQLIDVRLQNSLSSASAKPEQRFEATTLVDLEQDGRVLVPAGSLVRGVVERAEPAGRVDRSGSLALAFDQLTVRGTEYPMRAMATQVFESGGIREEGRKVGTAGAVGAIVGGIMGGLQGALLGAVVGSGGVIAATEGKNVELPAGAVVRLRLDSPVRIR